MVRVCVDLPSAVDVTLLMVLQMGEGCKGLMQTKTLMLWVSPGSIRVVGEEGEDLWNTSTMW